MKQNKKITRKILPDLEKGENGPLKVQLYTLPNVAAVVAWMGYTVRFNMMEHQPLIEGEGVTSRRNSQDLAFHAIEDNMRRVGINPGEKLGTTLATIGKADPFHPMEDWFLDVEWDGKDRIAELAATVPTDSQLWPVYLRKWLLQVVEAATGWRDHQERSLPHCLVFAGEQGIGKTQWFRHLAQGYVRTEAELHLSKSDAKDHKLDVLRFPIVELSEIDATFGASNISTLKTFLSAGRDVIRPPYGRRPEERIRSSVFGGTVNDAAVLKDDTGSRRFWPVLATGPMTWQHEIDMQQLFSQVYELWAEGEPMYLSGEEDSQREIEAVQFEDVAPAADAVAAHWEKFNEEWDNMAIMSISEICQLLRLGTHPAVVRAARGWLEKHVCKSRTLQGRQRAWVFPVGDKAVNITIDLRTLPVSQAKRLAKWKIS